jgi:hypothetical protein
VSGPFITGEYKALTKRGITEETCRKFGYQVGRWKGKTVQITPFYNEAGDLVAQQLRTPDKDFPIIGSLDDASAGRAAPLGARRSQVWSSPKAASTR